VSSVSTEEYFAGKELAPRPLHSVMDLSKLRATGFEPEDARVALEGYVSRG
jgi:dTDP-4-dehydrorhamnose 3,5-epimerase